MGGDFQRPEQPEPFLRGCAWPGREGVPYPRCDPGPKGLRLPMDTREMASVPAGVRFEFTGEPDVLEVDYRTQTGDLGYRGEGAGRHFVVYRGGGRIDSAEAEVGEGTARLRVGEGAEPATLYLPEGMRPTVLALRPQGGAIEPAPTRPRWLCYGDSIAEGWCAAEPAGAWPHIVAREQALGVVNLGYAGSARGEIASAEDLASLPADLISIAHGTNCWTRTPHSAELFAAGLRAFLDIVRAAHPVVPIVAVSPMLRVDAEDTPNALGARLLDLRVAFERVVEDRQKQGDAHLRLFGGRDLLAAERFPDGIHPDAAGHADLARVLGPIHRLALTGGSPDG